MPDASTWPAFKAALVTKLETRLPADRLGLWWPGDQTEGEGIYLGAVEGEQDFAAFGSNGQRMPRDETYNLSYVCQSKTVGPNKVDLTAAGVDVAAFHAIVDQELALDPQCSSTVLAAHVASFAADVVRFERGAAIRLAGVITATAELI